MPFLLAEILNFQGSTHHIGVGSFSKGVKMIPYYLTGILMYVNPTIQFLMGRFYFHEPLEIHRLIAFCFIWVGVGFTIWHNLKEMRK